MFQGIPRGGFYLQPGVELIPQEKGGIVLQSNPLRALRVNHQAFQLLNTAKTGVVLNSKNTQENRKSSKGTLQFVDAFCKAEILKWEPPKEPFEPYVSIIVPVYNREQDIAECLESLLTLDYPENRREIIVVDDASTDQTPAVASQFDVKLIRLTSNSGQSSARNVGVQSACGDIIAFIDSDCIADPRWLQDLLPYFQDPRLTVVGGYVDSFYRDSWLDRYEITHSALNMGKKRAIGVSSNSAFYVPTCNMLVRKKALQDVGGLDERLRVGEDVDLCWKLKAKGYRQMYVPKGRVMHKHRNHLWQSLKRRFDYGTSEAVLYRRYPMVTKRFPWQLGGVALLVTAIVGLLSGSLITFPVFGFILLFESLFRKRQMQAKFKITIPWIQILKATLRSHGIFIYYLTCYLLRYYLVPALLLLLIVPQLALLTAGLFLYPTLFEYVTKKPQLRFLVFLFFFWAEHAFYQTGVFLGCLKQKRFRLYRISFVRAGF